MFSIRDVAAVLLPVIVLQLLHIKSFFTLFSTLPGRINSDWPGQKNGKQFIMTSRALALSRGLQWRRKVLQPANYGKLKKVSKRGGERESEKKFWLSLDSLGLFLTRGGGKRQMSDKFRRLRGVLIVLLCRAVWCLARWQVVSGGEMRQKLIFLCGFRVLSNTLIKHNL